MCFASGFCYLAPSLPSVPFVRVSRFRLRPFPRESLSLSPRRLGLSTSSRSLSPSPSLSLFLSSPSCRSSIVVVVVVVGAKILREGRDERPPRPPRSTSSHSTTCSPARKRGLASTVSSLYEKRRTTGSRSRARTKRKTDFGQLQLGYTKKCRRFSNCVQIMYVGYVCYLQHGWATAHNRFCVNRLRN